MALAEARGQNSEVRSQSSEAGGTGQLAPTLRDLERAVRQALAHPPGDGTPPATLDLSGLVLDPPRIGECTLVEGARLAAIAVDEPHTVGFDAFLDGVQRSHVVDYAGAIPIVAGRSAAVVRVRVNRRMTTWADGHVSQTRLYAPVALVPRDALGAIQASGLELRNTLPDKKETSGHPIELLRFAVDAVKRDREKLERDLAELWVVQGTGDRGLGTVGTLFVDGGLPTGDLASTSMGCVGVIKSHHTIYAAGDSLPVILALGEAERSSVFVIQRAWGPPVLSWYLRLREPPSHDPFMGLVRVEVARAAILDDVSALSERADAVSRWILAERAPLALPDARWDRMVYGIRDCEEYLRATAS